MSKMKKPTAPSGNINLEEIVNTPDNLAEAARLENDAEVTRRLVEIIFAVDWLPC